MEMVRYALKNKITWLIGAFIAFWAPTIIFLGIAGEILERKPIQFDSVILEWIHGYATPSLDTFFLIVTNLGGILSVLVISLLLGSWYSYKKQWKNTLIVAAGVGGAGVANVVLKGFFQRDRPDFWQSSVVETSFSFPSGHAMLSSALILSLIVILWNTRYRLAAVVIGFFAMALVGLSRIYFGVHFPTDIIAGWCVSAAWVVIVGIIVKGITYKLRQHRTVTAKNS